MKNYLLFLVFILFSISNLYSQDSLNVLFLGNSYTYVNDLPNMLKTMASSKALVNFGEYKYERLMF